MRFATGSLLLSFLAASTASADFSSRGIPDEASQEISRADGQRRLTCIAFAPNGGWSLLSGRNGYINRNIPDEVHRQMERIANDGHELKCIAFAPNGGWSLLYGRNGYINRNIPDEAHLAMHHRRELIWIAFGRNNEWSLFYE
ncbi:MAG: hypothetical protein EA424_00230 [Planctomycetaceae bacterium]|nr:MAG: hypothetical protein EA424_00230 [Planctomycetaceae bacterium]